MGKKVLTVDNYKDYLNNSNELIIDNTVIVTWALRDYLAEESIPIVFDDGISTRENKVNFDKNTNEIISEELALENRIKQLLRKEYNVVREVDVIRLTEKILAKIQKLI